MIWNNIGQINHFIHPQIIFNRHMWVVCTTFYKDFHSPKVIIENFVIRCMAQSSGFFQFWAVATFFMKMAFSSHFYRNLIDGSWIMYYHHSSSPKVVEQNQSTNAVFQITFLDLCFFQKDWWIKRRIPKVNSASIFSSENHESDFRIVNLICVDHTMVFLIFTWFGDIGCYSQ